MFQLAFSSPAEPIQKAKQAFAGGGLDPRQTMHCSIISSSSLPSAGCSNLHTPNGNFLKGELNCRVRHELVLDLRMQRCALLQGCSGHLMGPAC